MNKKLAAASAAAAVAAAIAGAALLDGGREAPNNVAFHITLASPDLYEGGVYSERVALDRGEYTFRFVPNGDSPRVLGITLRGDAFGFSEDFELVGTAHQTGISEYYTWDYDGRKRVTVPGDGAVLIEIDPNGNVRGAVSVDLLRN